MNSVYQNLKAACCTNPFRAPRAAWLPVPFFAAAALAIGFSSGLFEVQLLTSPAAPVLPFTMFVFPALLEELFFRGILIPRNIRDRGQKKAALAIVLSTLAFVIWHPANALIFDPSVIPFFFNPAFLGITALLGITCGTGYVLSRSIWVPVIIHWATVILWVFFLGGTNKLL